MTVIDLLNEKYKGKHVKVTNINVINGRGLERDGILTDFHIGSPSFDEKEDIILFRLDENYNASYLLNPRSEILIIED